MEDNVIFVVNGKLHQFLVKWKTTSACFILSKQKVKFETGRKLILFQNVLRMTYLRFKGKSFPGLTAQNLCRMKTTFFLTTSLDYFTANLSKKPCDKKIFCYTFCFIIWLGINQLDLYLFNKVKTQLLEPTIVHYTS